MTAKSWWLTAAAACPIVASILYVPALENTDARETTGVTLGARAKPEAELSAASEEPFTATALPPVADAAINFVSSQIQAAIDSEKAHYSATYTGRFVISDFWCGDTPRYESLTVVRDIRGTPASTITIDLETISDKKAGRFLVRPAEVTIKKAMAKLQEFSLLSLSTWVTDQTTLLSVETHWKVEALAGDGGKVSEVSVAIAGYDMDPDEQGGHQNFFKAKSNAETTDGTPDKDEPSPVAGVLEFPCSDGGAGLYLVTVTVTEKDPLHADRSVEAEKTLARDVIDAVKQALQANQSRLRDP